MTIELVTIPCRSDNYAFVLHNSQTGETMLVDAPDAAPIKAELDRRGWKLTAIFVTPHHNDHTDGVAALRAPGTRVIGAAADAHRLPSLDLEVSDGDEIIVCGLPAIVLDVSGHTIGHVALHVPGANAVFTADSLMALGCGRLFEGDAATMWASLSKIAALPPETLVCSGHEYTATNARFAQTIEPENHALQARAKSVFENAAAGVPTVPSTLSEELDTNPFLRAGLPEVKATLGMSGEDDISVFAEIRRRKDNF